MVTIEDNLLELQKAVASFDHELVESVSTRLVQLMKQALPEHPESFIRVLKKCVEDFDFERATNLCALFNSHLQSRNIPYPPDAASNILKILQRKRLFKQIIFVADQLLQSGSTDPAVQMHYAQALIDQGHFTAAINVLIKLLHECESRKQHAELYEIRGLLGRVYKQIYINAAATGNPVGQMAKRALMQSFDHYHEGYVMDINNIWHGINAVAIWHRADKDGIELPGFDISNVTSEILASIDEPSDKNSEKTLQKHTSMWAMATAAEACLATGDYQLALRWLDNYVDEAHVASNASDAFEVASTLRQFEEVWQLNDEHPEQSKILQLLRAALLSRNGGSISPGNPQGDLQAIDEILDDKAFEGILGSERFKNLRWLKTGFERAQCVCKFIDKYGDAFGTGFLMHSKDLNLSVPDQWVVITNAHVVSNDVMEQKGNPRSKPTAVVCVQFEAGSEPEREFHIDRILAWSPRHELDFSVLALTEQGDFTKPYPVASALPLLEDDQRIYLIGHPRGGQLSFSLYDNMLIDHDESKVHYRSPSMGGSSGSPVFNQAWDLIGLHHAGGTSTRKLNGQPGTYSANEGLWIQSIISAIASDQ